jgi:glucose-1-phosphate thymidylyltransferase
VLIARDFLGADDFVMYLCDNMLQQGPKELVDGSLSDSGQSTLAHVVGPRQFGLAEIDGVGEVMRLGEKPDDPPSDLALVGVYLFDSRIHDAVAAIEPSDRGELEVTDAIPWLLDHGHRVLHDVLVGWWIDTGKKDPLSRATATSSRDPNRPATAQWTPNRASRGAS